MTTPLNTAIGVELRRASSKADKWPLAGVARQGPVTIGERQARGVIRISSERQTKIRQGRAGERASHSAEQGTSVHHDFQFLSRPPIGN